MGGRYLLGVILAILSGVAFNLGSLIQKLAVMKSGAGAGLIRRLIRNRQWLAGFALSMIVGSPLNMIALSFIGPAIIPGLSSIGLAVMAICAVRLAGEKFRAGEIVGICLVIFAVTVFGLSGMAVDMRYIQLSDTAFLIRLGIYTLSLTLFSLACHAAQRKNANARGVLRTINAGLLFAQSNLWLGILTELLSRWINARFALAQFPYILIASAIVTVTSFIGIAETQRAFAIGEASKLLPIQNVPSQILPVAAYFTVFALHPAGTWMLPLTLLGVSLVLAGGYLLAGRQLAQPLAQAAAVESAEPSS